MASPERLRQMDSLPDPHSLTREELQLLIDQLVGREQDVSNRRRVLHAQIDALRRELVDRLRDEGNTVIFGPDVLGPGLTESPTCEERPPYRLWPPGPEGLLRGRQRLARNEGRLVGGLFAEGVQLWLARDDGELLATMWPGEYRARLDPLVVIDEEGRVVARGGEQLYVSGDYLPSDDSRIVGYNAVFYVSRVLRDP
jgi:hypothetical protein